MGTSVPAPSFLKKRSAGLSNRPFQPPTIFETVASILAHAVNPSTPPSSLYVPFRFDVGARNGEVEIREGDNAVDHLKIALHGGLDGLMVRGLCIVRSSLPAQTEFPDAALDFVAGKLPPDQGELALQSHALLNRLLAGRNVQGRLAQLRRR